MPVIIFQNEPPLTLLLTSRPGTWGDQPFSRSRSLSVLNNVPSDGQKSVFFTLSVRTGKKFNSVVVSSTRVKMPFTGGIFRRQTNTRRWSRRRLCRQSESYRIWGLQKWRYCQTFSSLCFVLFFLRVSTSLRRGGIALRTTQLHSEASPSAATLLWCPRSQSLLRVRQL